MKVTIDEEVCKKYDLPFTEALLALAFRSMKADDIHNMLEKEVLVRKNGQYLLTQRWNEVLDEILSDSSGNVEKSDAEILELSNKMRECFPKGKMRDNYGRETPYYYRCNNSEVVKKLKKFFSIFGNYSDEDILDATKRYVDSFKGNYSGMRLVKYFILKDDLRKGEEGMHVEQISDLLTFLENKEGEEEAVNNLRDWQRYARN